MIGSMWRGRRSAEPAALTCVLALVLAVGAGCGSSDETTTTSSAESLNTWANSVCGAVATWQTSLTSTATQFKDGKDLSKSSVDDAAAAVKSANTTLETTLRSVGKPPTPAGDEAKADVEQLSSELKASADQIQTAASNASSMSSVLNAVSVASAAIGKMGNDISATVTKLKALDPKGEWEKAFSQSQACQSLNG
jgi:uncharacterized phage infection (PIP) family protein YhgE